MCAVTFQPVRNCVGWFPSGGNHLAKFWIAADGCAARREGFTRVPLSAVCCRPVPLTDSRLTQASCARHRVTRGGDILYHFPPDDQIIQEAMRHHLDGVCEQSPRASDQGLERLYSSTVGLFQNFRAICPHPTQSLILCADLFGLLNMISACVSPCSSEQVQVDGRTHMSRPHRPNVT